MNSFATEIKQCESDKEGTYFVRKGESPIILSAAHGVLQKKRNGKIKLAEPFTRAIAKYVSKKAKCYCLVKNEDTGVDPNKNNHDEYKKILVDLVKTNRIKVLIDVHGAKRERDFDVVISTSSGETSSQATITKLSDCLSKNGVKTVFYDEPFKGGFIIKDIHQETGIDCIQLEINRNFRDLRKIKNLRKICKALTDFSK